VRIFREIVCGLITALAVFAGGDSAASGSIFHNDGHFEMKGDSLYVVPQNGRIHRLHKDDGRVIWVTENEREELPLRGNSYAAPVFDNGRFFVIDMDFHQISSVDCATGRQSMLYEYNFNYPWADQPSLRKYKVFIHEDLLIVWRRYGLQAIDIKERTLIWKAEWARDNPLDMYDCSMVGDSLYILNSPAGNRFEMLEMDCSTGAILDRTKKGAFFEYGAKLGVDECFGLGVRNGAMLVLLSYKRPNAPRGLRLYEINLVDKSVSHLIEHMEESPFSVEGQAIWPKPVVSDSAIFYRIYIHYDGGETSMLAAKSLLTGETLWNTSGAPDQTEQQNPFLVDGDRLFTGTDTRAFHRIICRNASTGDKLWTAELPKFSPSSRLREMKMSDGRLYVLSDYHMRALNSTNGSEIWKTRLWGISKKGLWRSISDSLHPSPLSEEQAGQIPGEHPQEPAHLITDTVPTMEDVERLIEEGNDIAAIKAYRRIHGVGLADAKAAVDAIRSEKAGSRVPPPEEIAPE